MESLSQEDACYLIRQATLEDMLQELRAPAHRPAESLEKRCERIYRSWGVSTCDANKRYLTGALRVMMGSDHRLAIRKEILGPVAEEYNLTVAAVDSALRRRGGARGGRALFRRIKTKRNPELFQGQTAHKRVPGVLFLRCEFFPCAVVRTCLRTGCMCPEYILRKCINMNIFCK